MSSDKAWWERVAEGVRVELAVQRREQHELATVLNRSRNYVSLRVNGKAPFKLDEIETAADWLGTDVASLESAATR